MAIAYVSTCRPILYYDTRSLLLQNIYIFQSVQLISVHDCYTLPESNDISLIFVFGYGTCTCTVATVHYTVLIMRSSL